MAGLASIASIPRSSARHPSARRTLIVAGFAHALHDGYTDLIYLLLPIWQAEFALGYGVLALVCGLYTGAMAGLQIPVSRLAERVGGRVERWPVAAHASTLNVYFRGYLPVLRALATIVSAHSSSASVSQSVAE